MPIKADIMRALASNTAPLFVAILLLSCIGLQPHSPNLPNSLDFFPMHSEESTNSTNFTTSGGSGLAVSGEPGYVGDVLIASIMVTNSGNASGAVALVISPDSGGESFQGEHITISPGSTRQVSSHFTLLSPGTSNFDWLVTVIEGQDSLQLRGNFSVEVMPSQILNVSIDSIEWSNSEGLSFDALISLSAGKSRVIILDAYSVDQGNYQLLQSVKIDSNPGRRAITFDLGHPSAEQVLLEAIPIDWLPSSNSGNSTIIDVVEPVVTEESIVVGASFPSESPTPGSSPMVIISLENMGNYQAQSGFLRIISSSDQEILAETSVPTVMPGSKFTTDVSIPDWPASDSVGLEIQWHTNGIHSTSFYSIETENSQEGTELPFDLLAAGYGLLAGILIILLGTLVWRAVSTRTPSTSDLNLRDTKESERKLSKQEKVEIQCSYCDQRLMVPNNHSGGVRCPACSMEFVVNEEKNPEYQIARSSEDTLNCPECNQALRVKMENRPVMSRCPVCRTEFMAEAEEVQDV